MATELSDFEKEIRSFLDKPAGSLIYIAQRALKRASQNLEDFEPDNAAKLHSSAMEVNTVRLARKARWEAQQKAENQGRPEIEPDNQSTSADGGAVA
tara:strand:+ start:565 stop:855 length:291 start_codon:yes stop_codon:yes gene_type:complete